MYRTPTSYSAEGLAIAADYECCLSTICHHASNDSHYGKPFLLEDFQRENIWKPLFACGEMVNGKFKRKYRRALIGLPSGYGKTETAAATILTVATMEPVFNGQYGVVASSLTQVKNIFTKIKTMIRLDPDLSRQWDTTSSVITHRETGAVIMVFPNKADALESWHLNVVVLDELHVYRDSSVWDAALKGQKVPENPLAIGITTAGDKREGFLWELLKGAPDDPNMYTYWLGMDDGEDINDPKSWEPLMVASWVTWDAVKDQIDSATSKRSIERYTANRFPAKKDAYSCFTAKQLDECERGRNRWDWSLPWTLGIDGATSGDSFALVGYQEQTDSKGRKRACTREWVFDEPDEETGYYPLAEIEELIADLCARHQPFVVGVDPNRLMLLDQHLQDVYGIETVGFAQNNKTMCAATSLVVNAVKSRQLQLRGCKKLRRHLENTVEDDKGAYGTRFSKDSKKSKIDAAIALAIANLAYEQLQELMDFTEVY